MRDLTLSLMRVDLYDKLKAMGVPMDEIPSVYRQLDGIADIIFDLWLEENNKGHKPEKPQA